MFNVSALHQQTQQVFRAIAQNSIARDFLLIGGTALSLHIAHRQSNDLDFIFSDTSGRLPVSSIDELIAQLRSIGHTTQLITNASEASKFRINTGERLSDYARDYAIDGVKVTFFSANPSRHPKRFAFWQNATRDRQHGVSFAVLSLDALRVAKTLVLQDRVRSRDLFDLMILMRDYGYSIESFFDTINRYSDGAISGDEERLILRGLVPLDKADEGLDAVNVTLDLQQMYRFFDERITEHDKQIHAQNVRAANAAAQSLGRSQ